MKKNLSSRQRFLKVLELLQKYTDKKNRMDIYTIHSLISQHYQVGIKGIREDLQSLQQSTIFPVLAYQEKKGMLKEYYYDGRLFEVHELRLLMDAIVAAKFISKEETEALLMKIRSLTSKSLAQQLKNELQTADDWNNHSERLFAHVQMLHQAIENRQVIQFQYGRYTIEKEFQLSKNGEVYEVEPLGLVWNKDRYYLIGNYIEKDEIRQYRVDRMRKVQLKNQNFIEDPTFNIQGHVNQMVHMYSGEMISLEAQFSAHLINMVIDQFGINANITPVHKDSFILKTRIANSKGLLGWLLRWGSDVKILHPPQLIEDIKKEIYKMNRQYD